MSKLNDLVGIVSLLNKTPRKVVSQVSTDVDTTCDLEVESEAVELPDREDPTNVEPEGKPHV